MELQHVSAAKDALVAIKAMVGDALASPHCVRPPVPKIMQITRPELAHGIKHLRHFEWCHYLRCDASREVLLMIRHSIEVALNMLASGDEEILTALDMAEPFRHRLYVHVVIAALLAAERAELKREQEYWRRRNAMRIVPVYREACGNG